MGTTDIQVFFINVHNMIPWYVLTVMLKIKISKSQYKITPKLPWSRAVHIPLSQQKVTIRNSLPSFQHTVVPETSDFLSQKIYFLLDGYLHHRSLYKISGYGPIPQTITHSKCSWNSFVNIYLIHSITQDKNGISGF